MYSTFVILFLGTAAAISAGFAAYHIAEKSKSTTIAFYSGGTVLMVIWTFTAVMVAIAKHSKLLTAC
jgi:hypothetical protein